MAQFLLGSYVTGAAFMFFCTLILDYHGRDAWKPFKYAAIWPVVIAWKAFILYLAAKM